LDRSANVGKSSGTYRIAGTAVPMFDMDRFRWEATLPQLFVAPDRHHIDV
jgi:hypothetical protein